MRQAIGLTAAGLLLAGCASAGAEADASRPSPAIERGQAIAARTCSRCHAAGPVGDSPRADAPPFRTVRLRNNPIAFQRRMAEIASGGDHYDMPPLKLGADDVSALSAYIESLGAPR
ncbi:cytochrome c [Phenylobacterium sp.]|uniref:c-type cytochrome n=1 Tax=Phenylobacterium sp. TaxID=1871053 RepID=UPI0035B45FEF